MIRTRMTIPWRDFYFWMISPRRMVPFVPCQDRTKGRFIDGRFTGAVDDQVSEMSEQQAVENTGPAGKVCFMHSRVLHASGENNARRSRNLFISQIVAADAIPLASNHIPSVHEGMILRGVEPHRIRSIDFDFPLPEIPETTFFDQQANS